MKYQSEVKGGIAIIRIQGKLLGGPETIKIHEQVKTMLGDGMRNILVDLHGVTHMNSGGIGCLITCLASVKKVDGAIKILKATNRIAEILRITDLITHFECYADEEEALASFER